MRDKIEKSFAISILLLVLVFHLWSFNRFPPPFPDDALSASRAESYLLTGKPFGDLEFGLMNQISEASQLYGALSYYLYSLPVIISGKITLTSIRSINILVIITCCSLIFLIGKQLKDWRLGILGTLLTGLSGMFLYTSHLARPDVLATPWGLLALYLTIKANRNNQNYLSILAALALIIGYDLHPRVVVYIPIILLLQAFWLYDTKKFNFQFIYFLGALTLFAGSYYLIKINPYQNSLQLLKLATVGNSRTPPLLLWSIDALLQSFQELYSMLKKEHLLIISSLAIALIFPLIRQAKEHQENALLLIGIVTATTAIFHGVSLTNIIMIVPPLMIVSARILYSFLFEFKQKLLLKIALQISAILGLCSYCFHNTKEVIKFTQISQECVSELERFQQLSQKVIIPDTRVIGSETFWFYLPNNQLDSWTNINALRRLNNYSFEKAMIDLAPSYFIFDESMRFHIKESDTDSAWRNKQVLYTDELNDFFGKYAQLIGNQKNNCNHSLSIYKLTLPSKIN